MRRWLPVVDAIYVLALMAFTLAGIGLTPFHGDEPMQIYMSGDYETAFIDRDVSRLTQGPPYNIDDDNQLRILNGSVQRYTLGLVRQALGLDRSQLPPRPGWDWGLDYQRNVETGHRPADALLLAGRATSAGFLALSVPLMFGIGWAIGGRSTAYFAAGLYALHPVVLLNGRRAVQEGSMLCFGLLFVWLSARLAARRARGGVGLGWWIALVPAGALALASKHTTVAFVAGGLGWVLLSEAAHFSMRRFLMAVGGLALVGAAISLGFIALSPALWSDVPARLGDLLAARAELLNIQVGLYANGPTPLDGRAAGIVTGLYLAPLQFYEAPAWATFEPITAEINRYLASPLAGYSTGGLVGLVLTLAFFGGAIGLYAPRLRPNPDWGPTLGLTAWFGLTALTLLVSPLDWQRYQLPLIPPAAAFAAAGLTIALRQIMIRLRRE